MTILRTMRNFSSMNIAASILLFVAAIAAAIIANSPVAPVYQEFLLHELHLQIGNFNLLSHGGENLRMIEFINDGLMTIFFLLVGLEIKRELLVGELSSFRKAALPFIAACGGMLFPVIVYMSICPPGSAGSQGLAIPMATDIAFSLGVLSLLGSRVPLSLKIFLTAFAVVDDIGGILVIALFYSSHVSYGYILIAALLYVLLYFIGKRGTTNKIFFLVIGVVIWYLFLNSFLYSLAFAAISVFVTLLAAYPMSKKEFVGRKFFNVIFLITMFFGGGMIPTFILINQLHMVNTVWAILIPGAFNVWNMILARTYYQSIPKELREASAIDGANEIQHFFQIMMPVCKPIIAVLALWSFVGMWNSYFDAMIYLNDANLQPLQLVLRSILVQNTPQPGMIADIQSTAEMAKVAEQLKYATIVVSSLPLLIMYPFFQKYFDKGVMVGSVKG